MNAKQFSALPERVQDIHNRVAQAVAKIREGASLQQAAREFGLSTETLVRIGRSALRKLPNGRYVARGADRLFRVLVLPTTQGLREIILDDSRAASLVGRYWNAVHVYLATGDDSGLAEFVGEVVIDASRRPVQLLTNLNDLDRLASAGVLSFESIYAGVR
jgi:helix-turn-helix, Psq domain